jgi:hypothetical protein
MAVNNCVIFFTGLFVALLAVSSALECHVCKNEVQNSGTCEKEVVTCQPDEDSCSTVLRTEQLARAVGGSNFRYYVSKECTKSTDCAKEEADSRDACKQIWFKRGSCVSCCKTDRCNRQIDLGMLTSPNL